MMRRLMGLDEENTGLEPGGNENYDQYRDRVAPAPAQKETPSESGILSFFNKGASTVASVLPAAFNVYTTQQTAQQNLKQQQLLTKQQILQQAQSSQMTTYLIAGGVVLLLGLGALATFKKD